MQKYLLGLWIFLLVACQEERLEQGLQSGFMIALSEIESEVETRTAPADLPDPVKTEFKVTIRNQETDKQQTVKWSEEVVPAEPGTYTLTAEFGENPDLGFDQPYYKGEKTDQTVRDGYTKEVSIPCEVANALVSIRIKEEDQAEFEKNFPDTYVKISVGSVKDQMWTDLNTSAYFKAGSTLSQLILYKGHETGELDLLKEAGATVPKSFQAKDHLIITLGLQGQNGNLSLVVEKAEIKEETISETIPMEWLPRPKVTGFDAEGTKEITYTETADAVSATISFSGAMPIEDWEMTLDFADPVYNSLNKKYTLSTLTDEERTSLTQAGIVLPSLDEAKDGKIDFTGLTEKLQVASNDETTNTIKLRVKANNRWSSEEGEEEAFTIKTIAPEIVPTAKPEDIWTKTLAVSGCEVKTGKLDPSTIQKYQYLDGSEWKDCVDGLAILSNIPADNQMQVRAVYREGVYTKPVFIEMEKPEQLPNSGMEEWNYSKVARSIITYAPYVSDSSPFWNTNNSYTTRYVQEIDVLGSGSNPYNCFPAVSYVPGRNGLAAEIRSTAAGRGNTKAFGHTELDLNKVAGELFIGDIEVIQGGTAASPNGDHYVIKGGKEFSSRPSGLRFYYKYAPCNSDTWKATIKLLDEDKLEIISKTYQSSEAKSEYTEVTIPLEYQESKPYAKCKYIYVVFSSTINTGSSLQYNTVDYTLWKDNNQETFDHTYVGSILTIDDIFLVYDK